MAKRFIDSDMWIKKKWFRKLPSKYKLFWFYLITNCDSVGVWEPDFELASYIIKSNYDKEKTLEIFKNQIKVFDNDTKWWIKDFCKFQYGFLRNNVKNKPHISYIKLLKKHNLFIDYRKTMDSLKDKEKEKEEEKEKVKKKKKPIRKKHGEYKNVLLTQKQYDNLFEKWGKFKLDYMIKLLDEGIEIHGYNYKNHNLVIQKWEKNQKDIPQSKPRKIIFEDED